jgi:hypothetical protein
MLSCLALNKSVQALTIGWVSRLMPNTDRNTVDFDH